MKTWILAILILSGLNVSARTTLFDPSDRWAKQAIIDQKLTEGEFNALSRLIARHREPMTFAFFGEIQVMNRKFGYATGLPLQELKFLVPSPWGGELMLSHETVLKLARSKAYETLPFLKLKSKKIKISYEYIKEYHCNNPGLHFRGRNKHRQEVHFVYFPHSEKDSRCSRAVVEYWAVDRNRVVQIDSKQRRIFTKLWISYLNNKYQVSDIKIKNGKVLSEGRSIDWVSVFQKDPFKFSSEKSAWVSLEKSWQIRKKNQKIKVKAVAAPKKVLKNKSVTGKKRLVLIPRKKSTSVPLPVLKSSDTNSKAKPKRKKTRSRQKKVFDYRNMKFKKYKSSPSPYGNAEAFSEAWWDINFRRSVQRLRNRTLDYGFVAAELKRLNRYSKMYPKLKKKHKIPSLQTVSSWYFKDFINRRNTTFNIKPIEDQVRLLRQFGRQGRVKGHLIRRYSAWRIVNWLRFELIHTQSPKEIRSLTRRYKKLIKNEKRFQYHVDRYTNTAKLLNLLGQSSGERQLRRALKGR